jgi:flagellar basal-body rod modification protein FlgD
MSPTANSTSNPSATDNAAAGAATSATDPLANESTFLTLLVSQLQNQDPLDPVDSNQFVSQLTAYSQLEQLIGIHQNTTTLATTVSASSTTPASTTQPTTGA